MVKPSECDGLPHHPSMILDRMPDAVFAVDRDGYIVFWNRAAARLFQFPAGAVLGRRPQDVPISPWFDSADEQAVVSALRREDVVRWEGLHLNGDGRTTALELSLAALVDQDSAPAGMVVVLRDISAAKRREQDLEAQLATCQGAPDKVSPGQELIPICSHCKRIRDPAGAWREMSAYLGERFGVRFTHGICPTCITDLNREYGSGPPLPH